MFSDRAMQTHILIHTEMHHTRSRKKRKKELQMRFLFSVLFAWLKTKKNSQRRYWEVEIIERHCRSHAKEEWRYLQAQHSPLTGQVCHKRTKKNRLIPHNHFSSPIYLMASSQLASKLSAMLVMCTHKWVFYIPKKPRTKSFPLVKDRPQQTRHRCTVVLVRQAKTDNTTGNQGARKPN